MKIDAIGMENVDDYTRCELKDWTEIACNIAKADYHIKVVDAMEKAENGEERYYTPPRYDNGRFRPDMRGRGYEEMYYRDMDMSDGRMYYSDAQPQAMNDGGARGYRSRGYSNYDRAMRGYEESKSENPHDEEQNTEKMKEVLKAFKKDMEGMKGEMSSKEKSSARTELLNIANSIV